MLGAGGAAVNEARRIGRARPAGQPRKYRSRQRHRLSKTGCVFVRVEKNATKQSIVMYWRLTSIIF
jgi:hypothetical protein